MYDGISEVGKEQMLQQEHKLCGVCTISEGVKIKLLTAAEYEILHELIII